MSGMSLLFYQHFFAKWINFLPAYLDAETNTPLLFLLATVSRKCLPSAWRCLIILLSVNSLFYSLSGLQGRGRGRGRRESEGERGRSEVSIQECALACLGSTQPWWLGGNPWQRGSWGTPSNTSSSFLLCTPPPPPSSLPCPFTQSVFVCSRPVCSVKKVQPWRRINEETIFYVWLVEHGKPQNPLLHIFTAAKMSPVSSTVPNRNPENPPDSQFWKLFPASHQLLLHRLRRVFCWWRETTPAHECCFAKW